MDPCYPFLVGPKGICDSDLNFISLYHQYAHIQAPRAFQEWLSKGKILQFSVSRRILTNFSPMFYFYTQLKRQKTFGKYIEMKNWAKMA